MAIRPARPRKGSSKAERLNVYMERPLLEQIRVIADARDMTPGGAARELIAERVQELLSPTQREAVAV